MAKFYPLEVTDRQQETRDAVVLTLTPRPEDADKFTFTQGQYLTFRREFDGHELRRSYSICTGVDEGKLCVGIKRVEGGAFSSWANQTLTPGEIIDAMPPMGRFHTELEPTAQRNYLAFAGGSGITPVLSLIKTTLSREPHSRFTLIYGNRSVHSIMFREALEDLKNTFMGRFSVLHVLENGAQDVELFSGRIGKEKCRELFERWVNIAAIDMTYICGPEPMMLAIAESLREHGKSDAQIKFELFASNQPGRAPSKTKSSAAQHINTTATVVVDGTAQDINWNNGEQSLLDAALAADIDAPYACKAGVCSTCRAMVKEGEVEMVKNHALEDYEVERGYVLTCQCYPVSKHVVISYDQ